jgi:hypothetical protein
VPKEKPKKKKVYRSPESRARQLAGLSGVKISDHVMGCDHIQKVNAGGALASVSEEQKKQIIEMYCKGMSLRAIQESTGLGKDTINGVKQSMLDHDSQFRNTMFKVSLREKLQQVVEGAADRVNELMPEMSAKDSVLALGISIDKLMAMDRNSGPDTLHQHVHLHAPAELNNAFMDAMKPKIIENES